MQFIEMTGKTLSHLVNPEEFDADALHAAGVNDESLVRVNLQGDIELRKAKEWEVIGGLIGDFAERIKHATHLDWA